MCACGSVWRMGEAPVGVGGRVVVGQPCRPDTFTHSAHVSSHDILRLERVIVHHAGRTGIKAIDVAKRIVPTYNPDDDNRKFENRVYSVLKHRHEEFIRVTEGMWAEVAQVGSGLGGRTGQEESELATA